MVVGIAVWLRLWRGRCHVLSVCHRRLIRIAVRWLERVSLLPKIFVDDGEI
jgi:hypothetical protein